MNEKKLGKILSNAVDSNKLKTGGKEVLQYIKGTKLIVLSKSLSSIIQVKIKKSADENGIPLLNFSGNSIMLGRLCGLSYGTSVVSLKNVSDDEVQDILNS